MLWTLFEILVNVYQAFLMVYFLRRCLHPKRSVHVGDFLCAAGVSGFFTLYLFFDIPVSDIFVFLIPLIYAICCFTDRMYIRVFWAAMLALLMDSVIVFVISLFTVVLGADWLSIIQQETVLRFSFVLISNAAVTVVLLLVCRLKTTRGVLSWTVLLLLLLQNAIYLLLGEYLFSLRFTHQIENPMFLLSCAGVLLCAVLSFLVCELLTRSAERELQYKRQLQLNELTAHHQEELKSMYTRLVTYQHDLKHEIQALEQLLSQNETQQGRQLLAELKSKAPLCEFTTGNLAVDALLTAKKSAMTREGIAFEYVLQPLADFPLSSTQLCAILGNLLDNAIEAIGRLPDRDERRTIRLTFQRARNLHYILCENPVNPAALRRSGSGFLSTKKAGEHGLGLQSIRAIVSAAHGECSFTTQDDRFTALISLPDSEA